VLAALKFVFDILMAFVALAIILGIAGAVDSTRRAANKAYWKTRRKDGTGAETLRDTTAATRASEKVQPQSWWATQSAYYKSDEWRERRSRILHLDGYRCRLCGDSAEHVHHLQYRDDHAESDDQLVSLCASCHDKVHGRRIKSFGRTN